jgi:hypothetical protein
MGVDNLGALQRDRVPAVTTEVVRNLALMKQGLTAGDRSRGKPSILDAIKQIRLLQLDSVNVVDRSHYLVIFSRIGTYDRTDLDSLLFPDRALFEQRSHEACFIPSEDYPHISPEITNRRSQPISNMRLRQLGGDPDSVLRAVLERIKEEGPLSSKDFVDARRDERKGWWDRKPERVALEILWRQGYLAVQRRANFQPYYDLPERVIPSKFRKGSHSLADFRRWAATNALMAQGIATAADVNDYYRQNIKETRATLEELVAEGTVVKIRVSGWKDDAYVLAGDLGIAEKLASAGPLATRTTLLSPFDNLIWFRDRAERLFGLHLRVEMYTPKKDRSFGYYAMPILHEGAIIGKADPKMARDDGTLIINNVEFNPGVALDEGLARSVSGAFDELARFGGCDSVVIGSRVPDSVRTMLEGHLGSVAESARAGHEPKQGMRRLKA